MKTLYDLLIMISGICVLLVPIITVFTKLCPPLRNKFHKGIKSIIGISEIKDDIEKLKDVTEKMSDDLYQHIEDGKKRLDTDRNLLRSSLIRSFSFYIDRGWISLEELEVLQLEYDQYRSIKGNGVIKNKWEKEILKLPNQPIEQ